jgi:dTDP-4-dehydrorhamnose 3,5-epimerase-like enzyme
MWKLTKIANFQDETGSIHIAEFGKHFNFKAERFFYLSQIGDGETRGDHAHLDLNQLITCVAGSFEIELDDGENKEIIHMSNNGQSLFVDGLVWRTMTNFSSDAVMLVLCDKIYAQDVVLRDYDKFLIEVKKNDKKLYKKV